jgi:hypothetical protein
MPFQILRYGDRPYVSDEVGGRGLEDEFDSCDSGREEVAVASAPRVEIKGAMRCVIIL